MKNIFALLFVSALITGAHAQTWNVQSDKAELKFHVTKDKVDGTIGGLKATIKFDASDLSKSSISGTADVNTISTKNTKRDDHLKSAEYFDAKKHPVISFKSTAFEKTADGYKMTGLLKIKGSEKSVVWIFTFKDGVFVGTTSINPKDFGVKMDTSVKMSVSIPVSK